jgi:uncharacterized protein YkwD
MKEIDVFNSINEYRKSKNLNPYVWHDFIAKKAFEHTSNMANEIIGFSHDGWQNRYKSISDAIPGIKSGSENVSFSKPDMNPVDAWKKSAGHNKNLLSDGNLCGLGYAQKDGKHYYTAIFMKCIQKNLP